MKPDSPHLSPQELACHAARRLTAADVLRVSDHLAECAVCREMFARLRPRPPGLPGQFLAGLEDETPTFDELDGRLNAAQHEGLAPKIAGSPRAAELLADLAEFRAELASLPVKFHGPSRPVGAAPTGSVEDKLVSPPVWRWRGATSWAAALAALFVALAIVWGLSTRSIQNDTALLRNARGQTLNLTGLPIDLQESVKAALHTGRLPPPPGSELGTARGVLAGATTKSAMTTAFPVGVVVREARPTFRWTARPEATGYKVSVVPADGGAVQSSPLLPATQTQWTPSEALNRGETYAWQVAASRDGKIIDRAPKPPAGEARFEVLDHVQDEVLSRVEKQAAGNALILGVAYWRAGLTGAAADQFDRLAKAHTRSSVAQELSRTAGANRPSQPAPAN